jgi:chemotaxis response regulator CheB
MKVLISEGDWIYRERIVELQTQVSGLQVMLEKPDALSIISTIKKSRPDVVMLGLQLTNGNILDVLKNIQCSQFIQRLIILHNPLFSKYQGELKNYQAVYISNSHLDFRKVIRILVEIQHDLDEFQEPQDDRDEEEVIYAENKDAKQGRKLIWSRNPGERQLSWR